MKKVINSAIAAFAMFSKIPMPRCDWEKDNIRYMLVFMPLVGAVIGAVSYVWAFIGGRFWYDRILESMLLFLIPFVLTGGIHLDGFLDTTDALSSWKSKEERVEILKDVHVGAFAVIRGVVWLMFMFAVYTSVSKKEVLWPFLGLVFVMSRTLNALSILTFPKAKETGTVNTWQKDADPKCKGLLIAVFIVTAVVAILIHPLYGAILTIGVLAAFFWYYKKAMKYFGGMTGDLAGYFVCVCEAAVLFILAVVCAGLPVVQHLLK